MKLTCIILGLATIILIATGAYCYIENIDGCRYKYSSWDEEWVDYSIIDNLTDPESFIAGLFWNLGLICLIATAIMIAIYKHKVKENPEIASISGAAKARKLAKLNEIQRTETIRLIRDCKLYTFLIPFYFGFALLFLLGLIGYCFYPEEDMWIVPIIEIAGVLSFLIVGINLIKKTFLMKKEINSRDISESELALAKNAFKNFVKAMVVITVVGSVVMSIAVLGAFEGGNSSTGSSNSAIYATAMTAVKSQLKAPSTAKFSNQHIDQSSSNTWVVTGTVEAQNSFGVPLRNYYKVVVTKTSDGHYRVSSCTIN